MNPLLSAALGAILRWGLTGAAGYFVAKGIWTQEEASTYVVALIGAVLTLAWSLYQKYTAQQKIVTAAAAPAGTSQEKVKQMVTNGQAPPATLSLTESPYLSPTKKENN
jgi:uncharacterized membrane protein YhiD involved in acid resistance